MANKKKPLKKQKIRNSEYYDMQLVFDESQKECLSEIWIDTYDLVRLLDSHRSSLRRTADGWQRVYPFTDLDYEQWKTDGS